MSKHGLWTVIIEDKTVIKKTGDFSVSSVKALKIEDDSFWSQSKFSNIHAIQFSDDGVDNDQVEYKDNSPNSSYDENILGNFRTEFINRFDTQYLADLQSVWDNNNDFDVADESAEGGFRQETEAEKIVRLGARPTSYTSA
tara:strand:+ start:1936 stop:2358 length:423 start_codon:yes stop_codon:yes gene_type:complete